MADTTNTNTTPDHTAARTTWVEQCAARFIFRGGLDAAGAKDFAEACAEQQTEEHGPAPAEWDPPADVADEDMSYWGD